MFAEVEIPIASYCENPPRILRSQAVLNAGRLKLHADKFSGQTLIKMLSNWLFYRPLFEQPLRVLQAVGSKQPCTREFVQHIAQVIIFLTVMTQDCQRALFLHIKSFLKYKNF